MMQHISEVMNDLYPNLTRLNSINWISLRLKNPVVFREGNKQFIIRNIRNIKGLVMCELCMDDDRMMKKLTSLPEDVQKQIDHHLKLQA